MVRFTINDPVLTSKWLPFGTSAPGKELRRG